MAIGDRIGRSRRTSALLGVGLAGGAAVVAVVAKRSRLLAPVAAGVLLCVLSVPATASSRASASRAKPHCTIPRGWRLVAKDPQAMIVTGTVTPFDAGEDRHERDPQWRYCLWRAGRMKVLVTDSGLPADRKDTTYADAVSLAGRYAAYYVWGEYGGGRYGDWFGDVYVVDLQSGLTTSGAASCCSNPVKLLLSATGVALWQVWSYTTGAAWLVEALSARTGTVSTLDQASTTPLPPLSYAPGPTPFADLQLQRCAAGCTPAGATFAWWTKDGVWHTARVD